MAELGPPILMDNGSYEIKAGFAQVEECSVTGCRIHFRTIVGNCCDQNEGEPDSYVGNDAQEKRNMLSLLYPVEHGIITNWDEMEKVWRHTFDNELKVNPEEHPVLLADSPSNIDNREKMAEIMFEGFNCPQVCVATQALLSLYASNYKRTTGIVVDSGEGVTDIVPICDGRVLLDGIQTLDFAGEDLTDYLLKMINGKGYSLDAEYEYDYAREIKEKFCYTALDYEAELEAADGSSEIEKNFELPDGNVITVGDERCKVGEAMFRPSLMGKEDCLGIPDSIYKSIHCCEADLHEAFYGNIVLSGGSTMFNGFCERLETEINAYTSSTVDIHVHAHEERTCFVYNGGSAFIMELDAEIWISKEEYAEYGIDIINKKCGCY